MIILWALLGGFCYRVRGGLLDDILRREISNFWIRSVWALYVMFSLPLSYASPVIFGLALLGVIPSYWGGKFDLTLEGNRTWKNYAWLSARGSFIMFPLALCFSLQYPWLWLSVLSGALMPAFYIAGLGIGEIFKIQGKSQWGEWLIGIAIGGVLWYIQH